MSELRLGIVILAAGESRRLGQPKQLVEVAGVPLLQRIHAVVTQALPHDPIVTVLGANQQIVRSQLGAVIEPVVINPAWREGLSSSVRHGWGALQRQDPDLEAVLFCLADQPLLDGTMLRSLKTQAQLNPGASLIASRYDEHLGAPCILRRREFTRVAQLRGDAGLRCLFKRLPSDQIVAVEAPELSQDLDTPADLARIRQTGR